MKELPEAKVYEAGLKYWPYRTSVEYVLQTIVECAPQGGQLLDIMCGPGFLLGEIQQRRPDLTLVGVDIDPRYITYGKEKYPYVQFIQGDVLTWKSEPFDITVCTGAVHHVPFEQQAHAIANIASLTHRDAPIIISDVYVDDYTTEKERKLAAIKLGYEYLKVTLENDAPDDVLRWTADILYNDMLGEEYKPSFEKRFPILQEYFTSIRTVRTWPNSQIGGYGDYVHVCRK